MFLAGKYVLKSIFFVLIIVVAGVLMAPAFLVCSQPLEKVDCVMVMVGNGSGVRSKGAQKLVEQGRSRVLLMPASNKIAFAEETDLGEFGYVKMAPVADKPVMFMGRSYRVFENTHLEMLKGKKIMDKLGYRSAIIVSSPYHMRRLQLIAGKVLGEDYQIGFTATPFEKYDTLGCFRSWKAFENVRSEYLKIGWFLVYSWFV